MNDVTYMSTSYYRDGYIFECGNMSYFSTLLSMLAKAETVDQAIEILRTLNIDGKPLCKHIFKVGEVIK